MLFTVTNLHSFYMLVIKMGELKKLVEEGKIKYVGLSVTP